MRPEERPIEAVFAEISRETRAGKDPASSTKILLGHIAETIRAAGTDGKRLDELSKFLVDQATDLGQSVIFNQDEPRPDRGPPRTTKHP